MPESRAMITAISQRHGDTSGMTGYYKVEFEAMARLVIDLAECADTMRSAMRKLEDIGPKGAGSSELEEACDDLQEKWGYGIELIADATGGITEKVGQSGRVYQRLEDEAAVLLQAVKLADKSMKAADQ
ncbi:hypothetical protein ACGFNV_10705 [Streptomyces sp. NPDC048751]|uniref:hypothetical protein n=1 Tax=Streptomyces sp. NPDC048751 TaxID=3365591 RepID=UPI00371C26DC